MSRCFMGLTCPTTATELDATQRRVIDDILVHKRNVFLTGSGGVGKSFVTKLLIDLLKAHYECVWILPWVVIDSSD
jgi:RecA-family ATPase